MACEWVRTVLNLRMHEDKNLRDLNIVGEIVEIAKTLERKIVKTIEDSEKDKN